MLNNQPPNSNNQTDTEKVFWLLIFGIYLVIVPWLLVIQGL